MKSSKMKPGDVDSKIDGRLIVANSIYLSKIDYLALKDFVKKDADLSLKDALIFFQISFAIIANIIRNKIGARTKDGMK